MPSKQKPRRVVRQSIIVKSEVPFFLSLIVVIMLSLGMVIIAQKIAISYLTRVFPQVAEYNYRVLRADIAALEERISQQMFEVQNTCRFNSRPTTTLPLSPSLY